MFALSPASCSLSSGPPRAPTPDQALVRPRPGRHLRHRLSHLRGQAPVSAVSAGDGARARRRGRRGPGRLRPDAGRDLRRQPLSLLRPAASPAARQAELLRATSPCSASTRMAAWPGCCPLPRGNLIPRRRPDRGSMRRRRVSRHRRPCGAARRGDGPRPRARRRRRPDRPRRRAVRAAVRAHASPCSTATPNELRQPQSIAGVSAVPPDADAPQAVQAFTRARAFDVVFDATGNRQVDGEGLRLRRPWRALRARQRGQGPDHLHGSGLPPQGDDPASAAATPPPRTFERVIAAIRERRGPRRSADHPPHRASPDAVRDIPIWATQKTGSDQGASSKLTDTSVAPRLSPATLAARLPYDRSRVTPGIVHLGVGAFCRAHVAVYVDDVLSIDPDLGDHRRLAEAARHAERSGATEFSLHPCYPQQLRHDAPGSSAPLLDVLDSATRSETTS